MNSGKLAACMALAALVCAAQDRMPPVPVDKMTEAQKDAAKQLASTPRTAGLNGPFVPLLRSPELMNRLQRVGEYLRYQSPLKAELRELAIIMTARHWTQQYEWDAHFPLGVSAGLKREIGLAIAEGRHPEGMSDEEDMIYNFVTEILQNHGVSDATYARVLGKFGEQSVVDVTGLVGYYSALGMVMNVARTPANPSSKAPKLATFPAR